MGRLFKPGVRTTRKHAKRGTPVDWQCKIRLGPYAQKRARLCTDTAVSETWAAILQNAVDRMRAGEPPDPSATKKLPRRLLESFGLVSRLAEKRRATYAANVADYVSELKAAGRDRMYYKNVERCLLSVGKSCAWKTLREINRDSLVKHLHGKQAGGSAARTINNIRSTVVAFCRWAIETRRMDVNPCDSIKTVDTATERKRVRRAFTRDECVSLIAVAGPREIVYRTALGTGLRRRELCRLQWRDVQLDDMTRPCLMLRAEATKAKRADIIPLMPTLAKRLIALRPANALPTGPVFYRRMPKYSTWLKDLVAVHGFTARKAELMVWVGRGSMR